MATIDIVLKYAQRGWHVMPLYHVAGGHCTCHNKDCQSPGKHPRTRNGLIDATTDPDIIRGWWRQWPGSNVAIRTGAISGIVALDVDPRHGGDDTLLEIQAERGRLPATVESMTGGGGRHIVFKHPGVKIKSRSNALGSGLDIRGDGGYIVAPPSIHLSGKRYEWEPSSLPSSTPLADMPQWLIDLTKDAEPETHNAAPAEPIEGEIIEGGRNQMLTSLAGTMRRRGMSADAVYAALMAENAARCVPPLSADEVMSISKSVGRYDPTAPFIPHSEGAAQAQAHDPMDAYGAAMAFIDLLSNLEGRTIMTGIASLDQNIGGLERQTLTVLAARPSMGKSTLAWQIARNVAAAGGKALFLSLEMSTPALWAKAACGAIGVRWLSVRMRQVDEATLTRVMDSSTALMARYGESLLIDDRPNTSETAWRMVEKHKPDVVIVDHLRLVADPGDKETKRLGVITQRLKALAKSEECAVLCLAQLNRGTESQNDKRPNLKDLRDSGEIEENADNVLMLYRDDYYHPPEKAAKYSITEVLVRKFRDDIRNSVTRLAFDTSHQWFEDATTIDLDAAAYGKAPAPNKPTKTPFDPPEPEYFDD